MKLAYSSLIAFSLLIPAANAATREEFRGGWSRPCGEGQICRLDIDDMKSRKTVEIKFSVEGNGQNCSWSVDTVYDKSLGGPVAMDPYGNYGFYLAILADGRLYSSGNMKQICGPQPLDQYYTSDVQHLIDYRSVFDHNGSEMDVDPEAGTILYREPKPTIAGTVKPRTLLFKADRPWDVYDEKSVVEGTAYVFKKGCEPAPYRVSGRHEGWHTLILKGPAPIREKNGCRVIGYKNNGNSTLKFVSLGD